MRKTPSGVSLALMVGTNHYQVLYYVMIMIMFYVVGKLIITVREKQSIKNFFISSAIALVIAAIGGGPGNALPPHNAGICQNYNERRRERADHQP